VLSHRTCSGVSYVWSQTALHYVSGLAAIMYGITYTKVTKLAASAQAPATMTMARANRAPVPPERSMGRSSSSRLPGAMVDGDSTGEHWLARQAQESSRGDDGGRAVSTRGSVHGARLAMATCRGLVLLGSRLRSRAKLPWTSPMTRLGCTHIASRPWNKRDGCRQPRQNFIERPSRKQSSERRAHVRPAQPLLPLQHMTMRTSAARS
jgi:hypothetical protein